MIRWANDSYWQDDQMVAEVDERDREEEIEVVVVVRGWMK